ncbi:hypothetical protein CW360_03005 [Pseudomonas fluvialis]|uniref:Uncharacterized protein n=1 Tax=Pseudomonas fluvialis TaxID=1793966 RepID=A0A2I0CTP8_9PSED|nr:hypothetical protein [Pseudomonas pharmacofabricae]PKF72698.1 hypothetical protein CW360_03005 [Pseudomonas pharmacofabricae]
MDRGELFYQFMQKYPSAEDHQFELNERRMCEIRLGMFHDIVEEAFVGVYLRTGERCDEMRLLEQDMSSALGVIRVLPEAALQLALEHAKRFPGRG